MSALTPLEIASGLVLGSGSFDSSGLSPMSPRAAMEASLIAPLRRGPCFVSFSGGRDSSAVLAVATAVARREGLPLPIPATLRFPDAAESGETEWQEQVVDHLGVEEWIRLEISADLDCVGPVASACLARHGLLWPFNAHFHAPLFARAEGGSFLTGIGGDELLGSSRWAHARRVLAGRARRRPRDVLAVGLALAPPLIRRSVIRRRASAPFPWLRPDAAAELERRLAADEAAVPFRWRGSVEYAAAERYLEVGTRSLALLAADANVSLLHPFLEPAFIASVGGLPRRDRFHSRREAMDAIFGDVLPEPVRARRSKASFDGAFWHDHSRELVSRWRGEAVDATLVDVDQLRMQWTSTSPDPRTYTLLQAVKLALDTGSSERDGFKQPVAGLVEPIPASRTPELPGW